MDISNHVTSLELSKRLHELGLKKEAQFYWNYYSVDDSAILDRYKRPNVYEDNKMTYYPAYLASELMEILPDILSPQSATGSESYFTLQKRKDCYAVGYYNGKINGSYPSCQDKILSDALAILLLLIIENKLWSPE